MEKTFQEFPHWAFHVDEVSAGFYRVKGNNASTGANLEVSGDNPEQLLNEAKIIAEDMERRTHRKPQRLTLRYRTGEEIRKGDRVRFHRNPAEVELVSSDPNDPNPEVIWHMKEFGGGVLISDPMLSGRTFIPHDQLDECEDLEFVSRKQGN